MPLITKMPLPALTELERDLTRVRTRYAGAYGYTIQNAWGYKSVIVTIPNMRAPGWNRPQFPVWFPYDVQDIPDGFWTEVSVRRPSGLHSQHTHFDEGLPAPDDPLVQVEHDMLYHTKQLLRWRWRPQSWRRGVDGLFTWVMLIKTRLELDELVRRDDDY